MVKYTKSEKVLDLMQSEIRNMSIECEKIDGINLSQGICDLPLPQILIDGIQEAVQLGYNHYTRFDGIQYLREQIALKAKKYNNITCDPENNIIVSCGATGALYNACYALLNAGDEVILFAPFYGYHEYTLKSLNIKPVYVNLELGTWKIDFNILEKAISKKTKAILISTPSNPCGKVFSRQELEELAILCAKYDILLFSDEIYEYITYDGKKHISPASMPQLKDRTITVSGYSKTFSITGWRIGYSIAHEEISQMIGGVNDLLYVCAPAPVQYAVAKAIEGLDCSFYSSICNAYQQKRDLLCEALDECNLRPYVPEGAYYVLADVIALPGKTSKEKAMYLLNQTGISTVPGKAFYHDASGDEMVRFCFAKDVLTIQKACDMLRQRKKKW